MKIKSHPPASFSKKSAWKTFVKLFCLTLPACIFADPANGKMQKCENLVSVFKTFENLLLQNYSIEFIDIEKKMLLGYVYLKFVQMVVPHTYFISQIIAK